MNIFKWKNYVMPLDGFYLTEHFITYFTIEFEKMLKVSMYLDNNEEPLLLNKPSSQFDEHYKNTNKSQTDTNSIDVTFENDKMKREMYEKYLLRKNNILNIEDNMYAFIFKLEFTDGTIRSVTDLLFFNFKNDKKKGYTIQYINELIIAYWGLRSDYYHSKPIKNVIITYKLMNKDVKNIQAIFKKMNTLNNIDKSQFFNMDIKLFKYLTKSNPNSMDLISKLQGTNKTNVLSTISTQIEFRYDGLNLPNTMDLEKWGTIIKQESGNSIFIKKNNKQKTYYNIFKYPDHNTVQVFHNKTLILTVDDYICKKESNNLNNFIRNIKNNEYKYLDGTIVSKKIHRKVSYIKPISKNLYRTQTFLTLDIETGKDRGTNLLYPICISIYDGEKSFTVFRNDFNSESDMIYKAFKILNTRKYHNQKVYIHNLSHFDGVFLLKHLDNIGNLKVLKRDDRLLSIKLEFNNNKVNEETDKPKPNYTIHLRDSLLILPVSLSKLGIAFKIKNPKLLFPIKCLGLLPLDYIGPLPTKEYFLSENDYNQYISNYKYNLSDNISWCLKKELISYCENDVISLYQVIDKFSQLIFNNYRLDINKFMTLSSIAFNIYRSNFQKELGIPKITGQMYEDISQSYRGGIVDVYLPEGKNLYIYDVNSEYPEAMCQDLPGNKVHYLEGDINLNDTSTFGFFKAEIEVDNNLNIPVLPVRINNTSMCPVGKWTGWYFSEELKDAQNNYGYKIKLIKGYNFERVKLFNEYVNSLYDLKKIKSKDDPMYLIVKLLLNMLYGRLGMSLYKEENLILHHSEAENYYSNSEIIVKDVLDLDNGKELVTFIRNKDSILHDYDAISDPNISIAIASAIVAYGRIKINKLKHMSNRKIYYSDTDSIITDSKLPDHLIGNELGQLKLEDKTKNAIFISPKVYGYIDMYNNSKVKSKGYKDIILFFELTILLYKNSSLKKYQDKWYKDWNKGSILIINESYQFIITENKRQLIFDSFNKLVKTQPFIILNNKILNREYGYILNITAPDFRNKLITQPT